MGGKHRAADLAHLLPESRGGPFAAVTVTAILLVITPSMARVIGGGGSAMAIPFWLSALSRPT